MHSQKSRVNRRRNFNGIVLNLTLAGLFGWAGTTLTAQDSWTYKTTMPTARGFVSGCALEGKIYVIGGFPTHFSVTSVVESYDPLTDSWSRLASLPSGRCGHATCSFDGKVYVSGDHMLNWGCPYHCTYCINHFYHNLYDNKYIMRRYGIERIINELKLLKENYNLTFIKFHDEDFLMRPLDNLRELSQAYKQEIGIPFVIETNPRSVTEEKVKILKEMNCVSASLAIETGNPRLRREVLKRVDTEEDIISAFSLLKEADIRAVAFNMLGIPFETRQTYMETVDLNRRARVHYPDMGFFYPFDGTELRDLSVKEGLFDPDDKNSAVYLRDRPTLHFKDLSERELIEMCNVFSLYVKLPEVYEPFIRRSELQDDLGIKLRKKLIEIYDKTVFLNDGWYVNDGHEAGYLEDLENIVEEDGASLPLT